MHWYNHPKCKYFELDQLVDLARSSYKFHQCRWLCSNDHVVEGAKEGGEKAPLYKECGQTFVMRICACLTMSVEDGMSLDLKLLQVSCTPSFWEFFSPCAYKLMKNPEYVSAKQNVIISVPILPIISRTRTVPSHQRNIGTQSKQGFCLLSGGHITKKISI